MKKTFSAVEEGCSRTYVADTLGSVNYCCVKRDLVNDHSDVVLVPTNRYESFEKMEKS